MWENVKVLNTFRLNCKFIFFVITQSKILYKTKAKSIKQTQLDPFLADSVSAEQGNVVQHTTLRKWEEFVSSHIINRTLTGG